MGTGHVTDIDGDPILFDGGQANLYAYVGNNPVNQRDPSGLWCVGFKCEAGGKCGPSCDAEAGLGPFKVNTSGDKSVGGGGPDGGDSGSGVKGKCNAGGKAGIRGCGRL